MTAAGMLAIGVIQAVLLLLLAPLLSGFSRVMRAKFHSRKGPPLTQNYRDLFKLMKRQEVISEQAGWVFRATPYITLVCMLLVAMLTPVLSVLSPLGAAGDLILIIYLFALPRFFFTLTGLDTGSPFGGIGSRRELLLSVMVEPILILVIFVVGLLAGSTNLGTISEKVVDGTLDYSMAFLLGLAAFAFAIFVEMGKLPFDGGEAEQELQEGPLAEFSGSNLALMKWGIYLKQLVLVALFLAIFLPIGSMLELSSLGLAAALLAFLIKVVIFFLAAALAENAMARMRFIKMPAPIWLALGAAMLSFVFYLANI